jgi:hemerythrin
MGVRPGPFLRPPPAALRSSGTRPPPFEKPDEASERPRAEVARRFSVPHTRETARERDCPPEDEMAETHAWNERLDVGNEAMDHDHHTQLSLVSAFTEAVEQRRPALARRLGEQLSEYSRAHFRSEELLMEAASYRDAPGHTIEHDELIRRIAEVNAAQESGNPDLALSLAIDFRTALAAHMNEADRRVADATRGSKRG